jgi:alpha-ketoglutarate-dependent taurine dioxygenase
MTAAHLDLQNVEAYAAWRAQKLNTRPASLEELLVEIADPYHLTQAERQAVLQNCARANFALYLTHKSEDTRKSLVHSLATQFNLPQPDCNFLADEDAITSITVAGDGTRTAYIPYTNRAIRWHTDGYYNKPEHTIRSMILHCARPATEGGENQLLDHDLAYIQLRDEDPEHIRALMHPNAMTIPEREDEDANGVRSTRAAQSGPVFSVGPDGHLHMRYTARTRSIEWKQDEATQRAVAALERLLSSDNPFILRGRLEAGMGIVCNNILHDRSAFTDSSANHRLLYRARYYQCLPPPAAPHAYACAARSAPQFPHRG